jgi:hypothetical protein
MDQKWVLISALAVMLLLLTTHWWMPVVERLLGDKKQEDCR